MEVQTSLWDTNFNFLDVYYGAEIIILKLTVTRSFKLIEGKEEQNKIMAHLWGQIWTLLYP